MSRSGDLERALRRISELREARDPDRARAALGEALEARSPALVARAAKVAADLEMESLEPALAAAFARLLAAGAKADRGCVAKTALADALYRLGVGDGHTFLAGVAHVQPEGGSDAAAGLRGVCALGLVRVAHPEALERIAELLADPQASVRLAAVRALAYRGHDSADPLLRLKACAAERDVEVTAEALVALLRVSGERARDFVLRRLEPVGPDLQQATALALGGTRLPVAFDVLHRLWDRARDAELREGALGAIATLRTDRALDFLLELVAEAPGPTAREALAALAVFRDDAALASRVRGAATAREDVDLTRDLASAFG